MTILIFLFSVLTSLLGGSPALSFDERFPTEINSHIIRECSTRTVINLFKTSHYFEQICDNNFWRNLYDRKVSKYSHQAPSDDAIKYNFSWTFHLGEQVDVLSSELLDWKIIYLDCYKQHLIEKRLVQHLIMKSRSLEREDIPEEIQLNIIGFCDPRTVIRVSRTCHRYNELCSNNDLWRRLYDRKFRKESKSKFSETTAKYHIGRNNTPNFGQDNGRLKSNNFFLQRSSTLQTNVKKSDFRPHYSIWQFIYHEKDQKRQREKKRVKDLIEHSLMLDENYPEVPNESVGFPIAQNSAHEENNDVIDLSSLFNLDDIPSRFDIFSDERAFHELQHPTTESDDEKAPVDMLNLFCKYINYLPSHDWGKFLYLRQINLSYNYIRSLPKEIGELTNLTYFDVSDNRLTDLPEGFFALKKIQNLFLAKNRLQRISESIGNFQALDILDLSYNDIKILPSVLVFLPITDLVLDHNPLSAISPFLKMFGPDKTDATLKILCVPLICLKESLDKILKIAQPRFRLYICLGQKKLLKDNNLLSTKNYIASHVEGYCSCDNDESE